MIITMQHCREMGYCAFGVRRFFNEQGLDFKTFLKGGIEEEALVNTQQGLALKIVEHAHVFEQ